VRTSSAELHADAVEALLDAMRDAGLDAARATDADVVLRGPAGDLLVAVKAVSVLDADRVRAQLGADDEARPEADPPLHTLRVVVADQVSQEARELLRRSDWGYLDRRGALWLRSPGLMVNDTSIAAFPRRNRRPVEPIRGRVALGVALRRLMRPEAKESVRDIATVLGASVSTVHDALKALREAALIDAKGEPLVPDLFNATAAVWRPDRVPVQRVPNPADTDLVLGLRENESGLRDLHGWVVGGDVGAAALGARLVVSSGAPPDFYVPTEALLRRAVRRLGQCSHAQREATVALAPSPVVTMERIDAAPLATSWLQWPVAHPVVVALDLAQDLSRGREILDEWTPERYRRVW
jgi:hypothetical protein